MNAWTSKIKGYTLEIPLHIKYRPTTSKFQCPKGDHFRGKGVCLFTPIIEAVPDRLSVCVVWWHVNLMI